MKPMFRHLLLACIATALPVEAQRTFVVDANNGPGTNFISLTAALAQAQHGDVYFIRAATYQGPFATDKGIALLGDPGVVLQSTTPYAALAVGNLPAGTCFEARGITFTSPSYGFQAQSCAGRVHLSQVTIKQPSPRSTMSIDQAAEVTVNESQFIGTVVATDSTLVITSSTLAGQSAVLNGSSGRDALVLTRSRALLADSLLKGGAGLTGMFTFLLDGDGLVAHDSDITAAATAPSSMKIASGTCSCAFPTLGYGALLDDSLLRYAPDVVVSGETAAIGLVGSAQAIVEPLPALIATGGERGGSISTTLASSAGDPVVLVLGPPADPVQLPPGLVAVGFNPFVVLSQGVQPPSGITSLTLPVPNNPQLAGHALALQAASFDVASSRLFFSNPAVVVLR